MKEKGRKAPLELSLLARSLARPPPRLSSFSFRSLSLLSLSLSSLPLQPDLLLPLGQVGHEQQRDHRVRRDADAVGREARVEREGPLAGNGLERAVDRARVRHLPVGSGLHLLDLRLDVVEGQRGGRGEEAGDHGACGVC